MLDPRFHDEIDACRPGSRDIDEPEMSRLAEALAHDPAVRTRYEAVQRLDALLVEAFAAVPVPAGLAERLLAGLQLPAGRQQAPTSPPADESFAARGPVALDAALLASGCMAPDAALVASGCIAPDAVSPAEVGVLSSAGRRRWVTRPRLLAALAASVLVTTGLWTTLRSPAIPAPSEMTTEAALWYEQLADRWQPVAEAPADLPLPAAIVGNPRGWQVAGKAIGRRGVVYRLAQGPQTRAVLFVLSARRSGLPAAAPLTPQSATGGLTIGAWQSQGLIYVLVVEGDPRAYRRFLRPGQQPLA